MRATERLGLLAGITAILVIFDQGTKVVATNALKDTPPRSFIGDLFRLEYLENSGSFLGLGGTLPPAARFWLLTVGIGAFLAALFIWAVTNGKLNALAVVAISLVLAGGLSNWADRLLHDSVAVDFMNVGIGSLRSGVFNFADLMIEIGIALAIIASGRQPSDTHEAAVRSQDPTPSNA